MKRWLYIVFIALFFGLCLVPAAGLLIAGPSEPAANEAPAAAPRLTNFDGSVNTEFLTQLRDYVGKGFYLRLDAITAWDTLCAGLFHTSANDDVLIGPDGWLFYGAAAGQLSGADRMSERELWCCARSLYLMQEYAESRGAAFVFTVPCGKYTLYPDHAPSYTTVAEGSDRESLTRALGELGVNYADLYEAFSAVDEELYWQWDSHWNARGAALAADTILAAAGREGDYFSGPFTPEKNHSGDLYAMLYPTGGALETDYEYDGGHSFTYTSSFRSYDDMIITTENAAADGSLLLYRDSSGRNLYPYLADSFGSAYISRLNNYDLSLMDEREVTVAVVELAERTLPYLLKYPAIYPAPERETSVLDGAVPADGALTVDAEDGTLAGCAKVTGTFSGCADDSPVYLAAGGRVYEAIPGDGAFTAYLPADAASGGVSAYILP